MNELVQIFEETIEVCPKHKVSTCGCKVIKYDDSMAYLQKQSKQRLSKKPLPPSQRAVKSFLSDEPRSTEYVIKTFLMRSAIIGSALYLFGDKRSLMKNSLIASASIEAYLFYWYDVKNKSQ